MSVTKDQSRSAMIRGRCMEKLGFKSPLNDTQKLLLKDCEQSFTSSNGEPSVEDLIRIRKYVFRNFNIILASSEMRSLLEAAKGVSNPKEVEVEIPRLNKLTPEKREELIEYFIKEANKSNGDSEETNEIKEKFGIKLNDKDLDLLDSLVNEGYTTPEELKDALIEKANTSYDFRKLMLKFSYPERGEKIYKLFEFIISRSSVPEESNGDAEDIANEIKKRFNFELLISLVKEGYDTPAKLKNTIRDRGYSNLGVFTFKYPLKSTNMKVDKILEYIINNASSTSNGDPLTSDELKHLKIQIRTRFKIELSIYGVQLLVSVAEAGYTTPKMIEEAIKKNQGENWSKLKDYLNSYISVYGEKRVNDILRFVINYVYSEPKKSNGDTDSEEEELERLEREMAEEEELEREYARLEKEIKSLPNDDQLERIKDYLEKTFDLYFLLPGDISFLMEIISEGNINLKEIISVLNKKGVEGKEIAGRLENNPQSQEAINYLVNIYEILSSDKIIKGPSREECYKELKKSGHGGISRACANLIL